MSWHSNRQVHQVEQKLHHIFYNDHQAWIYKTNHTLIFKFLKFDYLLSILDNNKSTAFQLSSIIYKPFWSTKPRSERKLDFEISNALAKLWNCGSWGQHGKWEHGSCVDPHTRASKQITLLSFSFPPPNYSSSSSGYVLDLCVLSQPF